MILNLAENLKTLMVANTKPVHVLENIKLQIHDRFQQKNLWVMISNTSDACKT